MDDAPEKPWNEAQWETFMKRADMRAARFGELLETLRDNPDCDMVISREMGWEDDDSDGQLYDDEDGLFDADEDEEPFDIDELNAASLAAAAEEPPDEEPVESIRAYGLAQDTARRIDEHLRPILRRQDRRDADEDTAELLAQVCINMHIATVKIARGHGMGYDDEVLCGNIVCCRIALGAAARCREMLLELRSKKIVPAAQIDALLPDVVGAHQAIADWIEELRARVWW